MGTGAFLRQTHLASADRVGAASSEAGLTTSAPVPDADNLGSLRLRMTGTPTAATAVDVVTSSGGLAMGYSTPTDGTPGVAHRWKLTSEAADRYRGYNDVGYLQYARNVSAGSASTGFPVASEPRTLSNGNIGFVRLTDGAINDAAGFLYKAGKTDDWTAVSILATGVDVSYKPAFCITPTGRLLAYFRTNAGKVPCYFSDDSGLTWALLTAHCRVTLGVTQFAICVETVGDYVMMVAGGEPPSANDAKVYWSLDGGISFAQTDTIGGSATVRTLVDTTGQAWAFSADTTTGAIVGYRVQAGGEAISSGLTVVTIGTTDPAFAVACHDDGSLWVFSRATAPDYPVNAIRADVSIDNGETWGVAGGAAASADAFIYDNQTNGGTPYGFARFTLGSWGGSLVMLAVTNGATAAYDNTLQELWFGGWDPLPEGPVGTFDATTDGTCFYNTLVYTAMDTPDTLGWTKTDAGAGATVDITNNGLNIVATATDNSIYRTDATRFSPAAGESYRFRWVFRVNSGGGIGSDIAIMGVSIGDGTNRQWVHVRAAVSQLAVVDNSGTIATSTLALGQFQDHTELMVVLAHDTPAAGGGTVSALYRIAGSTHWTTLAEGLAVAEAAGSATEYVSMGGTATADVDWDVSFLGVAKGAAGLHDGFTNPDDLTGRYLSSSVDHYVTNGIRLGAFNGPAMPGDSHVASTTYSHAARNIWLNSRPVCAWKSAADNANASIVFGDGDDTLHANMLALHGTNVPNLTAQFNDTDSWGSPSYSTNVSAIVWEGAAVTSAKGYLTVDGAPFIPHYYRSRPGRRYWIAIGAAPGTIYEITDNDESTIFVAGIPNTFTSAQLRIFGDRMGAVLPADVRYLYCRLLIGAMQVPDDCYRIGTFHLGLRHTVSVPYDSGFVDRYVPNVTLHETPAGHSTSSLRGAEKHELRIAWAPIDRLTTDYADRAVSLVRALDGQRGLVSFWRDTSKVDTLELYQVLGPPVKENVYGELADALDRLAELRFVQVPGP